MTADPAWLRQYTPDRSTAPAVEHHDALSIFRAAVARAPHQAAIHYFDGTLSYAELDARSDALAAALIADGVLHGDRVALLLQNVPAFVVGLIAAWKAGAIAVSLNPMNRERELRLLFADCTPKLVITHPETFIEAVQPALAEYPTVRVLTTSARDDQTRNDARVLGALPPQAPPCPGTRALAEVIARHRGQRPPPVRFSADDIALLVYTSGTTGLPKGAMNRHGNVAFTAQVYRDWIGLTEADGVLGIAPLFHITGLIGHVALAFLLAAPLTLSYRFEPGVMLDALAERRPAFTIGAITALIALMNHPSAQHDALSSLKAIYSGGAPIAPAVVAAFEAKFGLYVRNAYGLTETTSPATICPVHLRAPVDPAFGALSVGVPTYRTEIRIVDAETGAPVADGEAGEITIRGPQVVAGYWNRPEATTDAIRDGWLHTGDIGVMDADGWLYLVDRKKDMINAAGYKVWPREVEDVLCTHPAVREAAVVGVPDAYRGETVKAVLSLKAGAELSADAIIAHCRERMAAYKVPRIVEFIPELPKTVTGKILRRELRG